MSQSSADELSRLLSQFGELTESLWLAAQQGAWDDIAALCARRCALEPELLALWQSGAASDENRASLKLAFDRSLEAEALVRDQQKSLSEQLQVTRQASRLGHMYQSGAGSV